MRRLRCGLRPDKRGRRQPSAGIWTSRQRRPRYDRLLQHRWPWQRYPAPALTGLGRPPGDGRHLLVANAGSDESLSSRSDDELTLADTIASGGAAPRSIAVHGELVYVLNTGDPSLAGFRLVDGGTRADRRLAPGTRVPMRIRPRSGSARTASTLVVTEGAPTRSPSSLWCGRSARRRVRSSLLRPDPVRLRVHGAPGRWS